MIGDLPKEDNQVDKFLSLLVWRSERNLRGLFPTLCIPLKGVSQALDRLYVDFERLVPNSRPTSHDPLAADICQPAL